MSWLSDLTKYEFLRVSLAAAILTGLTCGILGVYVVQRRMAFIGDALAHTVLPGLAVASIFRVNLSLGALVAGILTAVGIGFITRREKVKEDTAIGVLFSAMFALGVILMYATKSNKDLTAILLGNLLGVSIEDLPWITGVFVLVCTCLLLFHKELELTSFDPVHAAAIGIQPGILRYLLLILLAITVVTCIQTVGVVLTSALLITPAAAATLLTQNFVKAMLISSLIAVMASIMGSFLSHTLDTSSGASIVLCCTFGFAVAWAIRIWKDRFRLSASERKA